MDEEVKTILKEFDPDLITKTNYNIQIIVTQVETGKTLKGQFDTEIVSNEETKSLYSSNIKNTVGTIAQSLINVFEDCKKYNKHYSSKID